MASSIERDRLPNLTSDVAHASNPLMYWLWPPLAKFILPADEERLAPESRRLLPGRCHAPPVKARERKGLNPESVNVVAMVASTACQRGDTF